jgi:hypothetical protein
MTRSQSNQLPDLTRFQLLDIPDPRVDWYLNDEDLHGPDSVNRKVMFTPVLLEKLAVAAPEFPSVDEAARRCINAALADRDRGA